MLSIAHTCAFGKRTIGRTHIRHFTVDLATVCSAAWTLKNIPLNKMANSSSMPDSAPASPSRTEIAAAERKRRAAIIQSMAVLDTPPEDGFDALARLAANVCDAPVALVSLIDAERVWFKAVYGFANQSVGHRQSFCCEAADSKCLLEVVDATQDPRFSENPVVTDVPGIFYYAGAPIMFDGVGIGTVCVMDYAPRELPAQSLQALTEMATIATALLRSRMEAFRFFSATRVS